MTTIARWLKRSIPKISVTRATSPAIETSHLTGTSRYGCKVLKQNGRIKQNTNQLRAGHARRANFLGCAIPTSARFEAILKMERERKDCSPE
jgi:hypothetical protein